MKAKDTVIAILKKTNKCAGALARSTKGNFRSEEMEDIWLDGYMEIYKEGKQEGIKEVVKQMISRANAGLDGLPYSADPYWVGYRKGLKDYGQAKLKEWGLE